jgi:hypothetical protein
LSSLQLDYPTFDALPGQVFDARTSSQGAVDAKLAEILGPGAEPEPPLPQDCTVTLPFGLRRGAETLRDAVVRELTGEDEEAMAKVGANPLTYLDEILVRGTVSIGQYPASAELVRELTIADRDTLLIAIRRVTLGDELNITGLTCPHCLRRSDITVHLGRLDTPLPGEYDREFEVKLRTGGVALICQPTGADQMLFDLNASLAEQNTLLIARTLRTLRTVDKDARTGSLALARSLGLADRRAILAALEEHRFGPRYSQVTMTHQACGQEVPIPLGPGDLFRG